MEIYVEGKATEFFVPNEVILNITFKTKCFTYDEVLYEGTKNVQYFVEEILKKNGFKEDDMKTRNFIIREETKYDSLTQQNIFEGFSFNQYAIIKFDYDKDKMAKIMVEISKLNNAPMCQIAFGIKNEKECRKSILAKAYKDAEEQAAILAGAAGKTLKQCLTIDFKPLTKIYQSISGIDSEMIYSEKACFGTVQNITNTFTPEDIELTETLYCVWATE